MSMTPDQFLSGRGTRLEDYYVELTPVSKMLCYRNNAGREIDVPIQDERLAEAVFARLEELGVRVVQLSN